MQTMSCAAAGLWMHWTPHWMGPPPPWMQFKKHWTLFVHVGFATQFVSCVQQLPDRGQVAVVEGHPADVEREADGVDAAEIFFEAVFLDCCLVR